MSAAVDHNICIREHHRGPSPLPQIGLARELFARSARGDPSDLRKTYLRLALQFHPDKRPEVDRADATHLFQAIAAAYEELLKSSDASAQVAQRVRSPVAAAAELGDLVELQRLLEEDPSRAHEADDLGVFPLMFAAVGGHVKSAEVLLEFGADLHAQNPIQWSSLLYAALGNHTAMVKFLVERGAIVTDHELILAAYTGNPDSLEALLDLYVGSVPQLRTNESKKTLLHLACEGMCFLKHSAERHAKCVELVLHRKVCVDAIEPKKQRTSLQEYVGDVRWRTRSFEHSVWHMSVLEKLCSHGASVTVEDSDGNCALSLASDGGLSRVREVLFSYR